GGGFTGLRSASGSAGSRTTSAADLSSRRPRYAAWRTRPDPDHDANATSATSSGRTQLMVLGSGSPAAIKPFGGSDASSASRPLNRASSPSENPDPTPPA